ncbi:phosphotransferase enzyme family protein [Planctomicrobium sp. SH661]|uniref:phosphotransferase enzyme family protein n=1 Tax=Planctomicrobium sp. SH661 TaxID=3448124 RepID=UPI003F5CB7FC
MSPPSLEKTTLSRVTARFLGRSDAIRTATPVTGGFSEAIVFKVEADSGMYALRGWPVGSWPLPRVLERHRWLKDLFHHGIPVAVPLRSLESPSTVVEDGASAWQLEPWLAGRPLSNPEMNPQCWRSLMHLLAKFHQISSSYECTSQGTQWFQTHPHQLVGTLSERRKLIAEWNDVKLLKTRQLLMFDSHPFCRTSIEVLKEFTRHSRQIDEELSQCERIPAPVFPCFRDLWKDHVLFSENNVTGLIDPTAARTDHPASDLSRLLGSFLGDDRAGWNVALAEYSSARTLSDLDRQLIHVFDRSSVLLSGMTWIRRWSNQAIPDHQMPHVVERMLAIRERLRSL